jgi:hypothetical protein
MKIQLGCCTSDMAAVAALCNCEAWEWCQVHSSSLTYSACVYETKLLMYLPDSQAVMSAHLVFAHDNISIKSKWMLVLSIAVMNLGGKCGRHCLVNPIFKTSEFIYLWNLSTF